jgi:hypothetical protein
MFYMGQTVLMHLVINLENTLVSMGDHIHEFMALKNLLFIMVDNAGVFTIDALTSMPMDEAMIRSERVFELDALINSEIHRCNWLIERATQIQTRANLTGTI